MPTTRFPRLASLRFIWVDDADAVTVGEWRDAVRRLNAGFAVIVGDRETTIIEPRDAGIEVDPNEPLAQVYDRVEPLRAVEPVTGNVEAADFLGFRPEYVVLVQRRQPFVVPARSELHSAADVRSLLATDVSLSGPLARLPGPPGPLTPDDRHCYCRRGHQIPVPWGSAIPPCPIDGSPLKC